MFRKIRRKHHAHFGVAVVDPGIHLFETASDIVNVKIAAGGKGIQQIPALRAERLVEHDGGQVLDIRIDRKSEQQQLDNRDANHHPKCQAVPPHLDKLFQKQGPQTDHAATSRRFSFT